MTGVDEKDLRERESERGSRRAQTELSSSFSSWQNIPSGYERARKERETEPHRH